MSISLAEPHRGYSIGPAHRILLLTVLFWLFSYTLHAVRGVMLEEQWGVLLSTRRAIAVTFGAGAFWIVLKRLESVERVDLGKVVGWIVMATLAVMLIRVAIEQVLAADPLPLLRTVRWSLTWSAYFGLWVMGAIAFGKRPAPVRARAVPAAAPLPIAACPVPAKDKVDPSDVEWLVSAIAPEIAGLSPSDRLEAARRIRSAAGGYELANENDPWASRHNARIRLANRIAALLERGR